MQRKWLRGGRAWCAERTGERRFAPVRRPIYGVEMLESRVLLSSLALSSVAGDSLVALKSSLGIGSNQSPDVARVAFAASGNTAAIESLVFPDNDGTTNYSYAVTGESTATVALGGNLTIHLDFSTASSGTGSFIFTSGGDFDIAFTLFTPPVQNLAPGSVAGDAARLNIAGGGGTEYNTSGTEIVALDSDGTFNATFNGSPESNGTYSYTQAIGSAPGIAEVLANDPSAPLAYTYLVFTSNTGGVFYLTDATSSNSLTDFNYGTFSIGNSAPTITSADSATFTAGAASPFTVTTTGNPTASLTETGTLPAGIIFVDKGDGTAKLHGTPAATAGGIYVLTIKAKNGVTPNAKQTFTLTVDQAPAITSANTTTFTVGTLGKLIITTTGFPTAAITETGTLPTGVKFVDNGDGTAKLRGTPAAGMAGSYPITIKAKNGVLPNAKQTFDLIVIGSGPSGNPVQAIRTSDNIADGVPTVDAILLSAVGNDTLFP